MRNIKMVRPMLVKIIYIWYIIEVGTLKLWNINYKTYW